MSTAEALVWVVGIALPLIQILGVLSAVDAVLHARTPQGSTAWAVALVLLPVLTLPLYWVFGRSRFGFARRRSGSARVLHADERSRGWPGVSPALQPRSLLREEDRMMLSAALRLRVLVGAAAAALALGACAAPQAAGGGAATGPGVISGTVTYLPRIALPPDAVVRVWLEDASRADTAATIVAEQTIPTQGRQVPIPFSLEYDRAHIDAMHRYVLTAEIHGEGGALLWAADTARAVLTSGAPADSVEIRVFQVEEGGGAHADALVGPTWRLVQIVTPQGATTPEAGEPYTVAFGPDGRYNGEADCNRYSGEYRTEPGGRLVLERGLSTLVACPPPSSADAFMGMLNEVQTYSVTGDRLRLSAGPDRALVFERAPG